MWSIAALALIWIAGIISARMTGKSTETIAREKPEQPMNGHGDLDVKRFKLETLMAIRDSAFQRWDKRRSYEWQLSISIWTAFAAFCALVLGKDFKVEYASYVGAGVTAGGLVIAWYHRRYLSKMFEHTIGDAAVQRWAEQQMEALFFDVDSATEKFPDVTKERDKTEHPYYPPLSKYGAVQATITALLAIFAGLAVWVHGSSGRADTPNTVNFYQTEAPR